MEKLKMVCAGWAVFCIVLSGSALAADPQIAAHWHTVGLRSNGTVSATGFNSNGQCDLSAWQEIEQVAVGMYTTVGLKSDGTVIAAGHNGAGQCDVSSWEKITQVAAGKEHTVGLKDDGLVVATGANAHGQCSVASWTGIKQVAAGDQHTVGLKSNGKAVAVGWHQNGQCGVSGWNDIQQVSAGFTHTVGLKSDGTVTAVGDNAYGQCDVSSWKNIIQVAAGGFHTLGLRSDGTVVATGANTEGQLNVASWKGISQVAAGRHHSVGLKSDNSLVAVGYNYHGECYVASWILSGTQSWYYDLDGDGYGDPDNAIQSDVQPDGTVSDNTDCNDADASVHPNAVETGGDGIDQDCDGTDTPGLKTWYYDGDGDGYGDMGDAIESAANPKGYVDDDTDCNDADAGINPGATEIAGDGIDQNCDGVDTPGTQTWYQDSDGDGYGDPNNAANSVDQPTGYVANDTDCNDADADINPGATEIVGDGIDQDCNGLDQPALKTWYYDGDGDGFGDPGDTINAVNQPTGYVGDKSDCNDADATVKPGALDIIGDGIDQDCDGSDAKAASGTIVINQDLSFVLPDAKYQSTLGDLYLEIEFKFHFGSQHTKPLWELGDSSVVPPGASPVVLGADLAFTIDNMVLYQSLSGQMDFKGEFKFFGEQNGKLLWELYDYTVK